MGYPPGKKGWGFYDMDNDKFIVSRDVVFEESRFPFGEITQNISKTSTNFLMLRNFGELPIPKSLYFISQMLTTYLHLHRSKQCPS